MKLRRATSGIPHELSDETERHSQVVFYLV